MISKSRDLRTVPKDYIPALLQTVLQKSPHDTAVHRKLMECVMANKSEVRHANHVAFDDECC